MKRTDIPFGSVQRLLRGYGLNAVQLAAIWDCSYNTAAARLRNPSRLTLRELELVSIRAGIPIAEIRESIKR